MRTCSLLAIAFAVASPASAADAAKANSPEFLLGDLGVRVDLPKGSWRMTRWSDWDFAGESSDGSVLVFVWATPLEVPVGDDAKAWGPVYTGKIEEMKATEPKITGGRVEDVGGRKAAFVDAAFEFGNSGKHGEAHGATIEIDGQDLHLMTVGGAQVGHAVEKARTDLVRRLEFTGALTAAYGSKVTTQGVEATLPVDWRPPLDREWNTVVATHADTLEKLGVTDVTGCWTAIRTRPMASPDLMVSCNRPLHLGVVDEYSWKAGETAAREKLFGKSLPPGERVDLPDRIGFVYAPRDGLAMGVAPDAFGGAVIWAMGDGELGTSVRETMKSSTFTGAHPVETGEVVSYWLTQRTFSPQVLCPSLCCLGGVGIVVVGAIGLVAARSRKRHDPDDDS